MKPLPILCAVGLLMWGCADPLEQRSTEEVGEQLERGISGQGKLIPHDSLSNPVAAPSASERPPDYPPRP